jgi:beta-lactamase regulating signal transducer with metallopeptidase domain
MPWLSCIISNVVLASFVALLAYVAQHQLRSAAIARALWVLVLVKLVTPPLVSIPLTESPGLMACLLGTCACGIHLQEQGTLTALLPWLLLAIWSAGASTMAWTAWRRWTHFQRLIATATPASSEWQSLADQLATELSLRRPPVILVVPGRLPPLVIPGWRGPQMLLPKTLIEQLQPSQRAALLLHELIHLKRKDHLVRLLELTVGVVFWWLPVAGAIGRQLRACEETCCDAAVVAHLPQSRRDYACLLLDVLDFAHPLPQSAMPPATAITVAQNVEARLREILNTHPHNQRHSLAPACTFLIALALLPCELRYGVVRRPRADAPVAASANDLSVANGGCEPKDAQSRPPTEVKSISGKLPFSMLCPDSPLVQPAVTDQQPSTFCCPS